MRAKTTFCLVALSAAVLMAAEAPDAEAKGRGRKRKGETVRLATPAGGPTTGAKGTITITPTRNGDDAVLRLRGLDRRTTYQVVDGTTGSTLGQVRTDRRGRATFDLTPGVRGGRALRTASADGTDGSDVPDVVEIVDLETGDTVLTGDTTGTLQGLYGYANLGNATESVTVTMGSDPYAEMEYFTFSYFAPPTADGWYAPVYELWADTSTGGLPLGVSSVLDLAGRDFQVRDENDDVVFRGALPDVEAYDIPDLPKCPSEGEVGMPPDDPWGGWENGGSGGEVPFDFTQWLDPSGDGFLQFLLGGLFGGGMGGMDGGMMGGMWGKTGRDVPTDPSLPPVDPPAETVVYTLWIEGAEGFEKAGDLVEPQMWIDDPWMDGGPDVGIEPWLMDGPNGGGTWTWDDSGMWGDPSMGMDPSMMNSASGTTRHGRHRHR
jgi:hypothetical protein